MNDFTLLNPNLWFRGRLALVTGASSGMGYDMALALGRCGANVGVHYRSNRKVAEELCDRIQQTDGKAVPLQADLIDPAQVAQLFNQLSTAFGSDIQMLVNNAGDWMNKCPIIDCSIEQWDRMFNVNARSVFLCCQQAVRLMVQHGQGGAIVNMGSLAGHTGGGGGTVPYAAAKAAVHTFTRGLAKELAPYRIRVNAIAPGMVDTPMVQGRVSPEAEKVLMAATPLKRFARPDEFNSAALFLLSPASSFITGEILEINGGLLMR
ncbi:MAG: SDR family oxidoreductase [Phycisphaerales bacterium]|nr:SDR family oxidoreductase [Phycisphaerales bacterium]